MRAAVLNALGKIELEDRAVPELQTPSDVLVRVKAVGICGTDLHMFREHRPDVILPRIMGHELSGEVVAVGSRVQHVKCKDRVVLDPVFACDACSTCQKGYHNVCEHVRCYGVQMDGGFQDYIVVDEKHLYPFSANISYIDAALAEPFSIASNILDRVQLQSGERMLLIGSGTIGLSVLQVAKSLGAQVMVVDVAEDKLQIAQAMGADAVANSKQENFEKLAEEFAPEGFEAVLDAVGITPLFQKSLLFAAPRGRIACIGFDGHPAEIPPVMITKKELMVVGSRMNCHRFPIVMQWLESGKIRASEMVTGVYPLTQIQTAFEETLKHASRSIKTVVVMD